jgi:type I restriction enzyme R subunit
LVDWLDRGSAGRELPGADYAPFNQRGGLFKPHHLFGAELPRLLEELNEALVA